MHKFLRDCYTVPMPNSYKGRKGGVTEYSVGGIPFCMANIIHELNSNSASTFES